MTPMQACVQAVAFNHGMTIEDVLASNRDGRAAYLRRVAAYVAHSCQGVPTEDVAAYFDRRIEWVYDVLDRVQTEIAQQRPVARDVEEARARAAALIERHGVARPGKPTSSVLSERDAAEARKLRAKGWSVTGLAKRYGVPPELLAPVVGEKWGASV